jgi:hypothetical protein
MGRHLVSIIRIALGTVFVYAGALKAGNLVAFAGSIAAYQMLPYWANYLVSAILPWLEIFCGVLLILGLRIRAASALVIVLNVMFMIALSAAIIRGLDLDCGCFKQGGGSKTTAWQALLRDALLLAASIIIYLRGTPGKKGLS